MAEPKKGGLNDKQKRFVAEYLIDLNATAAYKRAGYVAQGNSAEVNACVLLSNPKVATAVQDAIKLRSDRTEITQDRVLQEYAKLAFLDPRRFYNETGGLIPIPQLPADVAAALASMEVVVERDGVDEDGNNKYADVSKIKFVDKKGALDSVARHLGMFNDKITHSGDANNPLQIIQRIELVAPANNSKN